MFGHNNNQTSAGPATVQNPSMLDNVSTGDFSEGANPAITEVEKQVKEALAVHDRKQVEQTITDDTPSSVPDPGSPMASSVGAPSAVPASAPVVDPGVAVAAPDDGDEVTAAEDAVEEPQQEETPIPQPVTSTPAEAKKTDLASTVPGIQVQEPVHVAPIEPATAPNADAAVADVSPSAPIAPPPAPETVVADPPQVPDLPEPPSLPVEEPVVLPQPSEETPESEPVTPPAAPEALEVAATEQAVEEIIPQMPTLPEPPAAEASEPETPAVEESKEAVVEPESTPEESAEPASVATDGVAKSVPAVDQEKLGALKQHVLTHLEPLADGLDQTPEEEFKVTMMRIQANDNHVLLEKALAAAKSIPDDKVRAKALLDIVNEINYFSQQG